MKTNFNNIWQKCIADEICNKTVQRMSDLLAEYRYFKFQDEI